MRIYSILYYVLKLNLYLGNIHLQLQFERWCHCIQHALCELMSYGHISYRSKQTIYLGCFILQQTIYLGCFIFQY